MTCFSFQDVMQGDTEQIDSFEQQHSLAGAGELDFNEGPERKKKRESKNSKSEVMTLIGERLAGTRQQDNFDTFGKHVANKLRAFPRDMRVYAEKLINDVLFEGELGTLNRESKVVSSGSDSSNPYTVNPSFSYL